VPVTPTEHFVYSLEIKRDFRRLVRYECPAPPPETVTDALRDAALKAYAALGCRDVARVDFRIRGGVPYFIEVNPIPGLHPRDSDLVIMADLLKWDYDRLVETILKIALDRVKSEGLVTRVTKNSFHHEGVCAFRETNPVNP
jgi:D-alanine-D-alanine ligase